MGEERVFDTEISEEAYDEMTDKYVTIPPGASGSPQEGDSIYLMVEAGVADWKQAGKSLNIPLVVVEEGINKGKSVEWYAGISQAAPGKKSGGMDITKKALKAFGIEDKVLRRVDGKQPRAVRRLGQRPNLSALEGYEGAGERRWRAHKLLGWQPQHTLEEGLRETMAWYKEMMNDER